MAPFGEAAFAVVDFLAAADEADHGGEAWVAGHGFEEVCGLGGGEAGGFVAGFGDGVGGGPAALGFVDDDDLFGRGVVRVGDVFVAEVWEALDGAAHFAVSLAAFGAELDGVAGQGFAQDVDQGGVAGEVGAAGGVGGAEDGVEAAEGFAGAWDAGDEEDYAFVGGAGGGDFGEDGVRGGAEVGGVGSGGAYVCDVVAGVEEAGGVYDVGDWAVGGFQPGGGV